MINHAPTQRCTLLSPITQDILQAENNIPMIKLITITFFSILFTFSAFGQTPRNLLAGDFPFNEIRQALIYDKSWVPYPDYQNREGWNKIPEDLRIAYIREGEEYLEYQWQYIPATRYLDFVRNGNRSEMERPQRENQAAFQSLVMAELMEGKGRFLDDIVNGAIFYCDQTYWGSSAHLSLQKIGPGLPDKNDPTIDLATGRVAANLAWAYYFFHEAFDQVHPLISERIKEEIYYKVLSPYYTRVDMWWMGYTRDLVNNWNPWCNYNVLNCILLLEDDPHTLAVNVQKTMRSVDQFINYYNEDGGCEEGPGYWSHAGGKLFDYLELLYKSSGEKINIYNQPVVQNMGRYIYRAYIDGEYFINFADASAKIHSRPGVIFRYGKRINDSMMSGFGAYLAEQYGFGKEPIHGKIELALENLFNLNVLNSEPPKQPLLGEFYLPQTQIMGARDKEGSSEGFYFAAKGGHNAESHNHNDVGSFILYYDGLPALIDVGVGTYTAKTFSADRYDIWTMRSKYHNLPFINGYEQQAGAIFKAGEAAFSSSSAKVRFTVDIAGSYPEAALIDTWKRTYTLVRGKKFEIADTYTLSEIKGDTRWNFMTALRCEIIKPGIIQLSSDAFTLLLHYDDAVLQPQIEKIDIDDARLQRAWGNEVYRIVFGLNNPGTRGNIKFEVSH